MTRARAPRLPGCLTFLFLGLAGASAAVAQPTRFAYAISADKLHVLPVDPLTGTTGPGPAVPLAAAGASHIAIDPTGRYVWISHRLTQGASRGRVTTYRLVRDTAHPIETLSFDHPVEMVAWEPTGRFAYVASRSGTTGQATVFAIAQQTGLAEPIQKVTTNPPKRIEVDPSGRYLIALTATGTAAVYDIKVETGMIALRSTPFAFTPPPGGSASPLAMVAHPAGRFLSIAFKDRVKTYFSPDGVYGFGGSSVPLDKPEHVIVHPTGRYVFAASPSSDSIHVLRVSVVTNGWTEFVSTITGVPATDIALDPSGGYLYAAGPQGMATMKIDLAQGQLELVQKDGFASPLVGLRLATPSERFLFSTLGQGMVTARSHPTTGALEAMPEQTFSLAHASVDPANRYLAAINSSGGLDTLRIDPASGQLDLAVTLSLPYPVSGTAFDPAGRYLLTTCTAGASCGQLAGSNLVRWITSYSVDSSTGGLTEIGSLATPHVAALDGARSRLVFDPNGRWAYVARAQDAGSRLGVIGLNADGTLYQIQDVPLPNKHVFDIAVDATCLSNPMSQSLYVLSQETNGGQPVTANLVVLNRYPVNQWSEGFLSIPFDNSGFVQSISCRGCSWGRVVTHPTGRFLHLVTGGGTSVGLAQTLRTDTFPLTLTGQIINFNNYSDLQLTGGAIADTSGRFLYLATRIGTVLRVTVDQATGGFSGMTKEANHGQPVLALHSTGRIR